jgi:hypothetical protein
MSRQPLDVSIIQWGEIMLIAAPGTRRWILKRLSREPGVMSFG